MSDKNADQLKAFYQELSKIARSEDWQNILKVAKKILGISVNDKKAFHCKIVCLINLNKFDEALSSIEKFPNELNDFYFEKAYCQYRLNLIENALQTLQTCPKLTFKEKELLAQVYYRLERYEESYDVYRDIIKTHQDDFDLQRQTNFAAVVCALNYANPTELKSLNMSEYENQTYELCYNSACLLISKQKYEEAEEKLKKAEEMCKETFMAEEEFDESELENELAIIKVQLAYCLQQLGKNDEAMKVYNNVLKNKPSDLQAIAVASNNIVTLNNDQNIFDSKKRIKTATSNELEHKLTSKQRFSIAFNEILLAIIANQNDLVSKLLEQFEKKFTKTEEYLILRVSQFHKEKKYKEAEKCLKEYIDANKQTCSLLIKYYFVQILMFQEKYNDVIEVFKSINEYFKYPGVVNGLVYLYNQQGKTEDASNVLNNAIEYFSKTSPNTNELELFIKQNAKYQIQLQNWPKAAELYEMLYKRNTNDLKILSQLISAYSKFDQEKAKELSAKLPSFEQLASDSSIDIDKLEREFSLMSMKYTKSKAKDDKATGDNVDLVKKKKHKRKRKIILPKNYDPNVPIDAERWLPLRERSYYKGRRKRKTQNAVGKGTQGAIGPDAPQSPKPGTPASPPSGSSGVSSPKAKDSAAPAAAPPKPKPKVQQKKKKGSKW